jgi:uncharacterized protein YfaS (alpha-2-macroglobulin family)
MTDSQNNHISKEESPKKQKKSLFSNKWIMRSLIFSSVLLFLLMLSWVGYQYSQTQALLSISGTEAVNPDGGKIVLTYRFPVKGSLFRSGVTTLKDEFGLTKSTSFTSSLDSSRTKEIIRFNRPTPFNQNLQLVRRYSKNSNKIGYWLGLDPIPEKIEFHTIVEGVSIDDLLPTAKKQHAPEALNNQIAIVFKGHVGTTYRKRVKMKAGDLPFISLYPLPDGYFQWSDDKTLTFNFSREQPRFDTTYKVNILPDKLIDPKFQTWSGESSISITTTSNDVYVNDVSFDKQINWNTPVTFEFSGNMVGVFDLNKDKSTSVMPVKMTPEVEGRWRWINARTVRFIPAKAGWPVRAQVVVEFLPKVNRETDRNWTNNRELNRTEFFVKPRTQSISNISLRGKKVDPEATLEIKFSRALVTRNQLGTRASIKSANAPLIVSPPIKGEYFWKTESTIQLEPIDPWSELTEYTVSLNPEFNPDSRFEWKGTTDFLFTTAENVIHPLIYQIPEVAPSGSEFYGNKINFSLSKNIKPENSIWIEFNRPFGKHYSDRSVANGIQFTPKIQGEFVWLSDYLVSFTPEQGWQPETDYQMQMTKELLYFHEQHFAKNTALTQFHVEKDTINFGLNKKYQPDELVTLLFNKNLSVPVKIGRKYRASAVDKAFLPVDWAIGRDYEFEWETASKLKLIPSPYWPSNTKLTVKPSENLLPRKQSLWNIENKVNTEIVANIVSIESVNPSGKTSRNSDIEIVFNKQIIPADKEIGMADSSDLVSLAPSVAGGWHWAANNKLTFKAEEQLSPSTDYVLTVLPKKIQNKEFTWHSLDKDKQPITEVRHFHSPYQKVKSSSALFEFDENNPLKQRFLIDIELSEWTTFDEVEKRFSLWTNNTVDEKTVEVPLIYHVMTKESHDKVRNFRVISDYIDRPNENRKVYYQIEKGVPAIGGNATMYTDYDSDFSQDKPRFIKIKSINYSRKEGRFNARLILNAPVTPEKLKQFLYISEYENKLAVKFDVSVDSGSKYGNQFNYLINADYKPNTQYEYEIRQGLLAADGALTNEKIIDVKTTPNLAYKVNFSQKGNILSKFDTQNISIATTNANYFHLSIDQIFPSNVRSFLNSGLRNRGSLGNTGKEIFNKRYQSKNIHKGDLKNTDLTTAVDLSHLFERNAKGLYRVKLSGKYGVKNFRWFLSSDIALISRRTDQHVYVWAMSLNSAKPMANVKIELVDSWNQTVSTAMTNASGFVRLEDKDPRNSHVLLASKAEDISFLDMRNQQESFKGFDVTGVVSSQDASLLQAYLYGERGVYRPGDSMHLVGVVRDQEGSLPNSATVKLRLKDPTGAERYDERFTIDKTGVVTLDYDIPADARTGKWQAELRWKEKVIGVRNFKVEEFIPNKIKVELSTKAAAAIPGQDFIFDVQSNNLFGPPASGRKVNAQVSLRPSFYKPKGFGDFTFGHDDHRFQKINTDLIETRLDEGGHQVYDYKVPENIDSPIGLNLHYSATVIDDSGRGVAQYAQIPVHLFDQYVGIRRLSDSAIELGAPVKFETVNVTPAGKKIELNKQSFRYEVIRKRKVTHFRKNERGYYRYVTEKVDVPLLSELSTANSFTYQSRFSGEHYLQVTDLNGGQVTRYYFRVTGARDRVSIVEAPETVIMKARKGTAVVGSDLVVDIQAPFAGRLLLIAERDDVMWSKTIEMTTNTATVSLPIQAKHLPNFYLSAIVVQPAKLGSKQQPVYASGLLNINVQDPSQAPTLTIDAPKKVSPNGKLTIDVSIDKQDKGPMFFTLAAVDEGILDLTKFETPDMTSAFNRKQRLDVGHYSVYPWVMPFDSGALETITPSGSAPSRALIKKKRVNPDSAARIKSVALWSGLQKFDKDGKATVIFDVPEFDGSLRLMLVSFGDQRFSSIEQNITVRDDLVLKPSLPRFMANGDHFELPFTLFNSTGITGKVSVSVEHDEFVELLGNDRLDVNLAGGGETKGSFSFNVKDQLGLSHFTLLAQGLGEQTVKRISVPVRSSGNYVSLSDAGLIDSATPKTIAIPKVFKAGTENQALRIAPAGMLEFSGSLKYLLRYPHGCLEQTTSKLFPLLYFEDFAKNANFYEFSTTTPRYFLREGIDKIERMQLENGYFSYWSGSDNVNKYAFLYATHFLAEARNKGLEINEAVWNNLQYRLNKDVLNNFDNDAGYSGQYNLSHQVYGLYILALSGDPKVAEMNALLQYQKDKLKLHDRARLAAAFKLAGRDTQANELLKDVTSIREYDAPYRQTAGTFASNSRDLAILLDALLEVDPKADAVPLVIDKLSALRHRGRWGSTQDNAMAMLALGKSVSRDAKIQNGDVIVTLANGGKIINKAVDLSTVDLLSGEVTVETTGDAEANYFWQADGVSNSDAVADKDQGIQVRRKYLTTRQEKADMNNIHQGDLIIVQLTMSSQEGDLHNVAVTDLLPMGLEIENARLSTSADIPWLKSTAEPDYTDIRDDRMNLYLTLTEDEVVYYYTTRAVTVGHFAVPSVRAEAMYDEKKFSLAGSGSIKVLPMQ